MPYDHLPETMLGRSDVDAISIFRFFEMFPDEAAAEAWFEKALGPMANAPAPSAEAWRPTMSRAANPADSKRVVSLSNLKEIARSSFRDAAPKKTRKLRPG